MKTRIFKFLLFFFVLLSTSGFSQINLGGLMKEKAIELKDKAKEKANERLEKQRKEYDESNFNFAICFLDNSGTFESKEKGNAFSNSFINAEKIFNKEEKTVEERAYTNLRNGELFMAGHKNYLAEQSLKLAKVLYESENKTSESNYAQTISDLGLLYQSTGRYTKAKIFNEKALALRQGGDNKGMLLVSINNNAVLKKETGYYTEAEADFKKAIEQATSLNDELAKALLYNNLAMTYLDMNKLRDAESQMSLSLAEAAKVLKDNAGNYIKLQINLANIFRFQKKYNEAESLYLKAIEVKEKKLGVHPDLANLKMGLAQLYMDMGKTSEVEKLLLSAYDINKKKQGEDNPATLATAQELAAFYRFSGNLAKASDLITKVVERKKKIYSETSPNYVQALEDLALTQWLDNKTNEAKINYKTVIDATLSYINNFFQSLNENEKSLYWEKTNSRLQRFYSFALAKQKENGELTGQFYNALINTKGFLFNNSIKIRNIISSSNDELLKSAYAQWLETKENLNVAYQLSKEELAQEKINVDSLQRREDELEREISAKSALFKESLDDKGIDLKAIQTLLKTGEAMLELVEIREYNNGFTDKEKYAAFVVTQATIKLIELGGAKEIEKEISDFRENTINIKPENEAYAVVWKPLDNELTGISKIYLSLDGAYHQLSVNALKTPQGKYLIDKYAIQLLGTSRDLASVKQNESQLLKPTSAFLVGNPLYGKQALIEQLPGTEKEVKAISKLLNGLKVNVTSVIGVEATELKVKGINSPSVLHIATHGYFLSDISQMETNKVLGVDIKAAKENPLLRCGVLLADCDNVFNEDFHPAPNSENGVLTAYEAMSLKLEKTDLVVLSACETGLGSVKQGEGVYGLQRAFLIAGAKSIIMSLWSVSDEATAELMTLFYTTYAKTGNKQQSFGDAIKQLKVKYKEPFFWSAFVLLSR